MLKFELDKYGPNKHDQLFGEKFLKPQPYKKSYRKLRKLEIGEMAFSRKEDVIWLTSDELSS